MTRPPEDSLAAIGEEPTSPSTPPTPVATAAVQEGAANDGLDFERAHFDQPSDGDTDLGKRICNVCGTPIVRTYYAHGGTTICPNCQPTYLQRLGSSSFGLALLYGLIAGTGGALLWYGIRALADLEIGIIAIAVGYAVGLAVRKGAGPSQSIVYRVLAVALTYFAIVATYIPVIAADLMQGAAADPASNGDTGAAITAVTYVIAAGLSLLMPYFLITGGAIMGVVIMGIGLWEAWRLSAPPVEDQVSGPFEIAR